MTLSMYSLPPMLRKPADLGALVYNTDLTCALRHFPDDNEERDKLSCNIVHHKGEQGFVSVPLSFEKRGNAAPDRACNDAGHCAYDDKQAVGNGICKADHARGRRKAACKDLTLSADVPELHAECRSYGKRYAQEHCCVLGKYPDLTPRFRRSCLSWLHRPEWGFLPSRSS